MKFKRILTGILAVTLLAVHPAQIAFAEEETTAGQEADPNAGKTAEQIAEEEKAKLEAEKKASLETPADTNSLDAWPEGPSVYAQSAVVMDMQSGAILYAKKADEKHYPASITKLLTTLVALENAELTDKVTFSQDSVDILNWDDASIGMRPGEEISMNDALYAVLLASANEVSYAVAESTGINHLDGGYDTFIELMNERAKELGCTGSNWVNPNGLHDENHYTTAHDMALIASAVYQKEEFRTIMKSLDYKIPATNLETEERVFQQNHKMLWEGNQYYYEYCTGGKTGYTDQAMTTLVTMADNGNMQLAAVVMYDYGVDAYTDTRAMMDYVFDNFSKVPVTDLEKSDKVESFTDEDAYIVLPAGVDPAEVTCEVTGGSGTKGKAVYLYQGQNVGTAEVTLKQGILAKSKTEDTEEEQENTEKKSLVKPVVLSVAGVAIVLIFVLVGRYRSYKKRQARKQQIRRQKMMRRKQAGQNPGGRKKRQRRP